MRIGFDVRSLQSGASFWGIGVYTFNLITHLARVDNENDYFLLCHDTKPFDMPLQFPSSFKVEYIGVPLFDRYLNVLRDRLFLEHDLRRHDLDIVHFTSPLGLTTHFDLGKARGKSILTMYDLTPLIFGKEVFVHQRRLLAPLYHMLLRSVNRAAGLIAISHCTARDLEKHLRIPPSRVTVTHLGFSDEFHADRSGDTMEKVKKAYGLPGRFLLYTGNFFQFKNVPLLFDMLAILEKEHQITIDLVMAGNVHPFFREGLDQEISRRSLKDRVHFTGFVAPGDLPVLYRMAHAFIYPSRYEGFGLPVLEAMASGVPVICSSSSSLPEVAGEGALLFNPDSANECAQAVKSILCNEEKRKKLIEKGLAQSRKFSWKRCAEETLAVYREIGG